ncbi:MAG: PrsW family glutamic-type intramembrane protease [Verrucomicrobiales bacterium]
MPLSPSQRKLAELSRDRQFLIRGVVVILAVCIILGFVLAKFAKTGRSEEESKELLVQSIISYDSERDRDELSNLLLQRGAPTPEAIAENIRFISVFIEHNLLERSKLDREAVLAKVPIYESAQLAIEGARSHLTEEQRILFHNYAIALYKEGDEQLEAFGFLGEQAEVRPPVRFANEFLGHVLSRQAGQRAEALPHFQLEADTFPRSDFSRFQLLNLNLALGDHDALRRLLADDSYSKLASPQFQTELGIELRDPLVILKGVARADLEDFSSPVLPLSLFAGLIWFIVLAKLGGVERLPSRQVVLFALCLVAGFLSATFTLLLVVWQDNVLGFSLNGDFVNDLLYCFAAIGLREEFAKILFFLPFVPFIAKRCTQVEILIAAGCVGLGFATSENINYFYGPGGSPASALPRLLTASFLHISLTGLLGLAICRFWHYPKRCWEEAVGTFVAVVFVHGLYDALLIVRELAELGGILSIVVLALTVREFFRKIFATRTTPRQIVSPLAVFVLGSAMVVGAAWIFAMYYYDLDTALDGVGRGALGSAILAFIYINEMRDE